MEAMGLSPQNKEIYDPVREKWVDALPEEIVRQRMIRFLVTELGYPAHAILIEKSLSERPCLSRCQGRLPQRRIDILCHEAKTFRPLLLIECKATQIESKMFAQLLGYNAFIKAPLICLASPSAFSLRWEIKRDDLQPHEMPSYEELRRP